MRTSRTTIGAALAAMLLAAPAAAASDYFLKIQGVEGEAEAQGGLFTIESFRWDRHGTTSEVRQAAPPRYKAEGGRLVRVEGDEPPAEIIPTRVQVARLDGGASPVLTRPLSPGPGMLVVRAAWRGCRVGAAYPEIELRETSGSAGVVLEQAVAVSCNGETLAFNYEKVKP